MTAPNQAAASLGTDTRILKIPDGAIVSQVVLMKGDTAVTSGGAAVFTVGNFAATTGSISLPTLTGMLTGVNLTLANSGVIRFVLNTTASGAGAPVDLSSVKTSGEQFVAVSPTAGGVTLTGGSLKVMITYYMY